MDKCIKKVYAFELIILSFSGHFKFLAKVKGGLQATLFRVREGQERQRIGKRDRKV